MVKRLQKWGGIICCVVMELDFEKLESSACYKVLAALVVPRPIAWVTTLGSDGVVNAAPFSFFNVFGSNPPLVVFAPGNRDTETPKDTARNIKASGEFVVNLVEEALAEPMVKTASPLPYGRSELEYVGLDTAASVTIKAPRIAAAGVAFECVHHSTVEVGANRLVLGVVRYAHVREGLLNEGTLRLNVEEWHPIGRMASPDWYCKTSELWNLPQQ